MKTLLALTALLLCAPSPNAIDPQTLSDRGFIFGRVTDARNGEDLYSVRVFIVDAKIGTLTNEEGLFLLRNVPLQEVTIRFERLCFHPVAVKVQLTSELNQRRTDLGMPYDHEQGCDRRIHELGRGIR